jgi:hypothetical protein
MDKSVKVQLDQRQTRRVTVEEVLEEDVVCH